VRFYVLIVVLFFYFFHFFCETKQAETDCGFLGAG
jgi:hypothetical protein